MEQLDNELEQMRWSAHNRKSAFILKKGPFLMETSVYCVAEQRRFISCAVKYAKRYGEKRWGHDSGARCAGVC